MNGDVTTQHISCSWGACQNPVTHEYRRGGGLSECVSEYRCSNHPRPREHGVRVYRMVRRRRLVLIPEPMPNRETP